MLHAAIFVVDDGMMTQEGFFASLLFLPMTSVYQLMITFNHATMYLSTYGRLARRTTEKGFMNVPAKHLGFTKSKVWTGLEVESGVLFTLIEELSTKEKKSKSNKR